MRMFNDAAPNVKGVSRWQTGGTVRRLQGGQGPPACSVATASGASAIEPIGRIIDGPQSPQLRTSFWCTTCVKWLHRHVPVCLAHLT